MQEERNDPQHAAGGELSDHDLTRIAGGATAYQPARRQPGGNPATVADDVIVDGRIIIAENYDS